MDEITTFEAWYEYAIWGNEDFKDSLLIAWQACAEQKDKEIDALKVELAQAEIDNKKQGDDFQKLVIDYHDAMKELAALKAQKPFAWACWVGSDKNPLWMQLSAHEPTSYKFREPLYAMPPAKE